MIDSRLLAMSLFCYEFNYTISSWAESNSLMICQLLKHNCRLQTIWQLVRAANCSSTVSQMFCLQVVWMNFLPMMTSLPVRYCIHVAASLFSYHITVGRLYKRYFAVWYRYGPSSRQQLAKHWIVADPRNTVAVLGKMPGSDQTVHLPHGLGS